MNIFENGRTLGVFKKMRSLRSFWLKVGLLLLEPPFGVPLGMGYEARESRQGLQGSWILAEGYEVLGRRPECSVGVIRPKNLDKRRRVPKFLDILILKMMDLKWKVDGIRNDFGWYLNLRKKGFQDTRHFGSTLDHILMFLIHWLSCTTLHS